MQTTTLDPTRNPALVLEAARNGWTDWHPGDGTTYRIHITTINGGPDHADRLLLINCVGHTVAIQYADPKTAAYRATPWTRARWRATHLHEATGGHDWWPNVARPLLYAAGVA